jgi:hypothetical protein
VTAIRASISSIPAPAPDQSAHATTAPACSWTTSTGGVWKPNDSERQITDTGKTGYVGRLGESHLDNRNQCNDPSIADIPKPKQKHRLSAGKRPDGSANRQKRSTISPSSSRTPDSSDGLNVLACGASNYSVSHPYAGSLVAVSAVCADSCVFF